MPISHSFSLFFPVLLQDVQIARTRFRASHIWHRPFVVPDSSLAHRIADGQKNWTLAEFCSEFGPVKFLHKPSLPLLLVSLSTAGMWRSSERPRPVQNERVIAYGQGSAKEWFLGCVKRAPAAR